MSVAEEILQDPFQSTALILIGFQNDYFSPQGVLHGALEDRIGVDNTLRNSLRLIEAFTSKSSLIISAPISFTPDYSELSEPVGILKTIQEVGAFRKGSPGSEIIPEHAAFGDRITVVPGRNGLNAFADTQLDKILKDAGVKHLIFSGVVTSLCIDSTARSAIENGYKVTIVDDATCGRTPYESEFYITQVFPLYTEVMSTQQLLRKFFPSLSIKNETITLQIHHKMVEELAEKEKRYRLLLDNLQHPVVELHCGHIAYLNPAWTKELGFDVESSLKQPFANFVVEEYRKQVDVDYLCETLEERLDLEILLRTREGSSLWHEVTLTRVEPGKLLGMLYNVDARRKAVDLAEEHAARLEQTNQALEAANRQKDTFLACMSHELRTPLNAVLGFAESLTEGVYGPLNDRQIRAIRHVNSSGQHLLDLINDILDITRLVSGHEEIQLSPCSILDLCKESLRMIQASVDKKQCEIVFQHQLPADDVVMTDPRRIKQVLTNLLGNALKFSNERGQVRLLAEIEESTLKLSVEDQGIGIAEENLKRIFEPFMQIEHGLDRAHTGTGLGLFLVKRICEMMNGTVEVESELGVGTTLTCRFPVVRNKVRRDNGPMVPSLDQELPAVPNKHILLVEDEPTNQKLLRFYLQARGYQVSLASNGKEALDMAESCQPGVILMDIQMPVMDGITATRMLKRNPDTRSIPVIAITALAMTGDRERCLEAGAVAYLPKPVKLSELSHLLERFHGKEPVSS